MRRALYKFLRCLFLTFSGVGLPIFFWSWNDCRRVRRHPFQSHINRLIFIGQCECMNEYVSHFPALLCPRAWGTNNMYLVTVIQSYNLKFKKLKNWKNDAPTTRENVWSVGVWFIAVHSTKKKQFINCFFLLLLICALLFSRKLLLQLFLLLLTIESCCCRFLLLLICNCCESVWVSEWMSIWKYPSASLTRYHRTSFVFVQESILIVASKQVNITA